MGPVQLPEGTLDTENQGSWSQRWAVRSEISEAAAASATVRETAMAAMNLFCFTVNLTKCAIL